MEEKQKHNLEKITSIAKILGLLEETHRDKGWLWNQIKKHHVKTSAKLTMNSYDILTRCNKYFVSKLLRVLNGENIEGFENIKSLTKTYHWFFTDIVSASGPKSSTQEQAHKIIVLNELISLL